ncbi:MAG TPA: HWE histidine kinase domain-containing protein [Blastocatellia bacterium]|nr:HWE histidine kinase domain-containing protein [Blastocatellia bacterium]
MRKSDAPSRGQSQRTTAALDDRFARAVLEAAPTIIYVYDLKLERRIFQSRRMKEHLGHASSPDLPSEGEWRELFHPDDAANYASHRAGLTKIRDGEVMSWEFRMRDGNGDWRWFLGRDVLLERDPAGAPRLIVGCASEVTEQKTAEELKDILMSEMRHRAKNLTAVIEALSRQSRPKDNPEVSAHFDTFVGRLRAMLSTGDIILSSRERMADLLAVSEATLSPFRTDETSHRLSIKGPPITLSEQTAGGLALAFHELATNAVKYGALSGASGSISLSWSISKSHQASMVVIEWREQGGPQVTASNYEGFGSRLVRYSVSREPGADVRIDMNPDGLYCRIQFQLVKV